MVLRIPHYFDSFVCTAGECRDNCCYGGWQIDLDEDTVEFYKSVKGDFGDRLRASIDYTDTYCFKLENGDVRFLMMIIYAISIKSWGLNIWELYVHSFQGSANITVIIKRPE